MALQEVWQEALQGIQKLGLRIPTMRMGEMRAAHLQQCYAFLIEVVDPSFSFAEYNTAQCTTQTMSRIKRCLGLLDLAHHYVAPKEIASKKKPWRKIVRGLQALLRLADTKHGVKALENGRRASVTFVAAASRTSQPQRQQQQHQQLHQQQYQHQQQHQQKQLLQRQQQQRQQQQRRQQQQQQQQQQRMSRPRSHLHQLQSSNVPHSHESENIDPFSGTALPRSRASAQQQQQQHVPSDRHMSSMPRQMQMHPPLPPLLESNSHNNNNNNSNNNAMNNANSNGNNANFGGSSDPFQVSCSPLAPRRRTFSLHLLSCSWPVPHRKFLACVASTRLSAAAPSPNTHFGAMTDDSFLAASEPSFSFSSYLPPSCGSHAEVAHNISEQMRQEQAQIVQVQQQFTQVQHALQQNGFPTQSWRETQSIDMANIQLHEAQMCLQQAMQFTRQF
ncbi:MAG: hypothetical protein MHM6MM_001973 [Cercozoa sp. M6MM]